MTAATPFDPREPTPVRGDARLVLASASPRRLALLRRAGVVPDAVVPAELDEAPRPRELPADYEIGRAHV
jgi:septum formation protein